MADLLPIVDGRQRVPPRFVFADAPDDELQRALDRDGPIDLPIGCLLVRSGGRVAVVDAGTGRFAETLGSTTGGLGNALAREEIGPGDVDVVVITHAHPDHIGGLLVDDAPAFPRARHLIAAAELPFWRDTALHRGPFSAGPAMVAATLTPLVEAGLLETVDGPADVLDGVRMVPAPGHTPGHAVVEIGDEAVFLTDAVLHEAGFAHPDWAAMPDADPALAVRTRRELLGRAADAGTLVYAAHLDRGGRVRRDGDAFAFEPA